MNKLNLCCRVRIHAAMERGGIQQQTAAGERGGSRELILELPSVFRQAITAGENRRNENERKP